MTDRRFWWYCSTSRKTDCILPIGHYGEHMGKSLDESIGDHMLDEPDYDAYEYNDDEDEVGEDDGLE